jgi:hypothetical protein
MLRIFMGTWFPESQERNNDLFSPSLLRKASAFDQQTSLPLHARLDAFKSYASAACCREYRLILALH